MAVLTRAALFTCSNHNFSLMTQAEVVCDLEQVNKASLVNTAMSAFCSVCHSIVKG